MRISTGHFLRRAALAGAWAAAAGAAAPERWSAEFTLSDQFGRERTLTAAADRIRVLALADRAGSDQVEGWIAPLVERYTEAIEIHGVALLDSVPRALRPAVRALFRRGSPHPILLDWTGDVARSFDYRASQVNVVVLAPDGRIVHRFNGPATAEALAECFARIDVLLGGSESHAPPATSLPSPPPSTVRAPAQSP